jgi:hypothetical protein
MLEDAAQAYNPIIQAMIATANLQKQGQQQEIEKERNAQLAAQSKESLKNETERIKNEHQHQLSQIELMGKAHSLAAEAQHMQTAAMLRDLAAKGVDVGKLGLSGLFTGGITHGANPQDQLNTPPGVLPSGAAPISNASPVAGFTSVQSQGQTPDFSSAFPGPEAEARRIRSLAGAQAGGAAEAELPFQQKLATQKFGYESNMQDARMAAEEKIAGMHINSAETIAKLSRASQMALGQLEAKTRLQVAGMGGDEGSQNLVKSLMIGSATGEIKLNPANPLERLAYSQLQQHGFQEVDSKQILAAKEAQKMLPLFDRLEKFADQLPESTAGAVLQGYKTHTANAFLIPTKLQNDISMINSQAMVVGRAVEGLSGRPLSTQLKLDLDTLATPGTTKSLMKERIDNLRQNYVNSQNNVVFAGMPSEQLEMNIKKWGLKPIAAQSPQTRNYDQIRIGPNEHKIGYSSGKWYDVGSGQEIK